MSRHTVPFGTVIAERRLNTRGVPRRSVGVSLGKPRKTKGSSDWECPFRISGAGIRRVEYGFGVDAFQALTMALEGSRYVLDRMETPLAWSGVLDDHSGFQRFIPLLAWPRGTATGTARVERAVDREISQWAREAKRRHVAARRRKAASA
jgi:hypothetical protein